MFFKGSHHHEQKYKSLKQICVHCGAQGIARNCSIMILTCKLSLIFLITHKIKWCTKIITTWNHLIPTLIKSHCQNHLRRWTSLFTDRHDGMIIKSKKIAPMTCSITTNDSDDIVILLWYPFGFKSWITPVVKLKPYANQLIIQKIIFS